MANKVSLTLSNDEVEFVQSVEDQEEHQETTENLQMDLESSTQYVLEVEPVEEPKRKNKGKGKSSSLSLAKKRIMTHGFKWLKTIWIADTTLKVMKPWLKAINDESLKIKNQKMFLLGQSISQIMKQFFIHMKENQKSLTDCSFASFEEWCYGDGLSTMSGRLPEMGWEDGLTEQLFNLYSDCIMELRRRQEDSQSDSDQEQALPVKRKIQSKASLLSRNTRNTSTSFTTAPIQEAPADVYISNDYETTQSPTMSRKRVHDGVARKTDMWTKESSPSRNKKTVQFESESEEEVYHPGNLFKQKAQQKSVEEMSEPELTEPPMKKSKKLRRRLSSSGSESEAIPDEEAFTSMVDSLARAHSLTPSTGKISQSILIKDGEGFISYTCSVQIKFSQIKFSHILEWTGPIHNRHYSSSNPTLDWNSAGILL